MCRAHPERAHSGSTTINIGMAMNVNKAAPDAMFPMRWETTFWIGISIWGPGYGVGNGFTCGDTGIGVGADWGGRLGIAVSDTIGACAFGIGGAFGYDSTRCILVPHFIWVVEGNCKKWSPSVVLDMFMRL